MLKYLQYSDFRLRLFIYTAPFGAYAIALAIRELLGRLTSMGFLPASWMLTYIHAPASIYVRLIAYTLAAWSLVVEPYGLTAPEHLFSKNSLRKTISACLTTYLIVFAVLFLVKEPPISRSVTVLSSVALLGLSLLWQHRQRIPRRHRRLNGGALRVLIVGVDAYAAKVTDCLIQARHLPSRVVGHVRLPGQEVTVSGRVYDLEELPAVTTVDFADNIIIAISPEHFPQLRTLLAQLRGLCIPIGVVLDLGEGLPPCSQIVNLGGVPPVACLDFASANSLQYLVFKRAFDIVFSLFALLLTAPLMLLIAVAIKLSSAGPVFFKQERVGLNGKPFNMVKFRTMRASSSTESDTRWTISNDTRRTKVGTFLRRTNLDELPQFFNVLNGDMSVVGPRPERPYFVRQFIREVDQYNTRHFLKAGITGWAQVNGWRGDTSIAKRVEYDLYYLRNWTMWFDIKVIAMTVVCMFNSKNAY